MAEGYSLVSVSYDLSNQSPIGDTLFALTSTFHPLYPFSTSMNGPIKRVLCPGILWVPSVADPEEEEGHTGLHRQFLPLSPNSPIRARWVWQKHQECLDKLPPYRPKDSGEEKKCFVKNVKILSYTYLI